jgi:hypothetical protein
MPLDSLLVALTVLSVFAVFAGVLMWGDIHSGPLRDQPIGGSRRRRSF